MTDHTAEQIRLKQIVDRWNLISQGEWVAHTWDPMERSHVVLDLPGKSWCCRGQRDLPLTKEDAEFIAASSKDVGFLLAYIDRLLSQINCLKQTNA